MEFVGTELNFIHFCISCVLLIPPLWNLCWLTIAHSHTKKLKILALSAPAYYTILSASAFSGFVIWAMLGFTLTLKPLLMLVLWCFVLFFEIMRHKKQKQIRIEAEPKKRESFFRNATLKYCFDLCVFALLFVI